MAASRFIHLFYIYHAYGILMANASMTSNISCLKIDCEEAIFSNFAKSVMTSSCNQCFLSNYSICISIKRSVNQTSKFTFCDHKVPSKCRIWRSAIDSRTLKEHSNYLCFKNISTPEVPNIKLLDSNSDNFTIAIPNVRVLDPWSRLNISGTVVQFFCPDAVCTSNFDLSANETFLLKSVELPPDPTDSSYNFTINWTNLTKGQAAAVEGDGYSYDSLIEAVSVDYFVVYNDNLLEQIYAEDVAANGSLTIKSIRKLYSAPILVRYEKIMTKKSVNIGLIVLCVFLIVLICGMLLAVLARKHASQSLTSRYKRKPIIQDESSLMSSIRFDKQNSHFEEEYKLLPLPTKISIRTTNLDNNNDDFVENHNKRNKEQFANTTTFSKIAPSSLLNGDENSRKYENIWQTASIAISYCDLDLLEIIGQGQFGAIKRGYVGQKNECMVHCAKAPYAISAEESKIFLEHLDSSIKARSHPNVICFVGVCGQGDDLYVAMQLENGQNLRNLLRESRSLDNFSQYAKSRGKISLMSAQRLMSIMLGVCRGMGYLEDNKVLHDNLACVNIIIGDNGTPKIGGFGMATLSSLYKRQLDRDHEKIRWMPPETLANHVFTLNSQVWSFGIVVWEIITLGGLPYNYLDDRSIMIQIPSGLRLSKPSNCGHKLYEFLFNKIWNQEVDARPNFAEILRYFHDFNLNPETHIDLTLVEGFTYEPTKYVPR